MRRSESTTRNCPRGGFAYRKQQRRVCALANAAALYTSLGITLRRLDGSAGADQRADIVRPRHARQPVFENAGRDPFSDVERRIEDMTLRRIDEAHREILLSDLLGD